MALQLPKFFPPKTEQPRAQAEPPQDANRPPPVEPTGGQGRRSFSIRTGRTPVVKIVLVALPILVIGGLAFVVTRLGSQVEQLQGTLADRERQAEELAEANTQLTRRLEQLVQEREQTQAELETARRQLEGLTVELQQAQDAMAALQVDYDQVRESSATLEQQLAALQEQYDARQQRIVALERERETWERSISRLRERLAFADRDYQRMAQRLAALERRPQPAQQDIAALGASEPAAVAAPAADPPTPVPVVTRIREQQPGAVELPPIIVGKHRAQAAGPVRARLVEVNEPYRFVVIDKGTQDGVRLGMTFNIVRRAGAVVGEARVVQVRPQLAACDVVRMKGAEPPRVGDAAVERGR